MRFELFPNGDRAVSVSFPAEISREVNGAVLALCDAVDDAAKPGIVNCVPAYHTLLVEYDPRLLTYGQVAAWLKGFQGLDAAEEGEGRTVTVPVCYGGAYGPDLQDVADHAGLSPGEVVSIHTSGAYRVYMLGFRPGFPYLGGMDRRIATPRRATPRLRVEGGSVGIAGGQTGVYPEPSPGGWNIIGRTPMCLYEEESGALLQPGDTLRFVPIDEATFEELVEEERRAE